MTGGVGLGAAGLRAEWTSVDRAGSVRVLNVGDGASSSVPRYGRDIRPILSDRCFKCHGPDEGSRQAKLRLDDRDAATAPREHGAAVIPGDAGSSALWKRISAHQAEEVMPPPTAGKKPLSETEKDLLRRWIDAGAEYEPHWAFVPPRRPEVPALPDRGWARNPIDAFVGHRLGEEAMRPSPEADRETLARRVFLDLTGLPPTPAEIDAFLGDESDGAYERLVDRLMNEEPYQTRMAERLAAPWLDQARYADTNGIHMDAGRQMWLWRDWVIEAYRRNMPFDQFVTEQMAGDLIPGATVEQQVASGFNRNHVTTDEGGAIAEEYLVEYAAERTATTGSVFLGLTLGCARCHDHKFDPVSMAEFYSLYAYFNSIEEPGLYSQLPDPQRAFEPFIVVPTVEQRARRSELDSELAELRSRIAAPTPEEEAQRSEFFAVVRRTTGVDWAPTSVIGVRSVAGATLTQQSDGSILASGDNPAKDEYRIVLRTDAKGLRMIALEALRDASLPMGRVGRAPNGNAVLSGIEAEAVSVADPSIKSPIRLSWAWADVEQGDGDYRVVNAIRPGGREGWAVAAHQREGDRAAMFLSEEPFGFEGGTEIHVSLRFESHYAQHAFGRVRLSVGSISNEGLAWLPTGESAWFAVGPFMPGSADEAYEKDFGPEHATALEFDHGFGAGNAYWRYAPNLADGRLNNDVSNGLAVTYAGRVIHSPTARRVEVSLGSDDGFRLYLNGNEVAGKKVDRSLAADQDKAVLDLVPGRNVVVFKVVNTGGIGGMFWRAVPTEGTLSNDLVAVLLPDTARTTDRTDRAGVAWKLQFSPRYRELSDAIARAETSAKELEAAYPKTMVMKELSTPRPTFVLKRGAYDKPDLSRPVARGVPAALGKLPEGAPPHRLGLAQWLVSPEHPLVARVAVNRMWEMLFGHGIVRTTEDFGYQGEWPTHPELLDWLAVDFREHGWDVRRVLRLMVTSATYRQRSRVRPEIVAKDPDNRLLAFFPRSRLAAEQIRDQALYVSGLLVERSGGPSVKPYQPEGLWQEVAMLQSNTRVYERGKGDELWRRSMYTYWKRAAPPPSLMTFDAPTRETCTIRRIATNTPLQALVLWNDVQYVEAARGLAQRVLSAGGDDRSRLTLLVRLCAGRRPGDEEMNALTAALEGFRERFRASPEDAMKLLSVGESPRAEGMDVSELAAWAVLANATLSMDSAITKG
ncbi:MAG: PSD1 domain-containing protein [Phycisphaerae bacterium]|nr:PSD1 domain-containing protein [Phycisphaerae bacterium]